MDTTNPSNATNDISVLDSLTPQKRLFLSLLLEGKKAPEAHKLAGYDGNAHAAYVLKGRLDKELTELAAAKNMAKADLMIKLGNALELPIVDKQGQPLAGLSMNQFIRLAAVAQKVIGNEAMDKPKVTMVQINRFNKANEKIEETQVIETTGTIDQVKGS